MRAPRHRRENPKQRQVVPPPPEIDLESVAAAARYAGSAYHKDSASFAGQAPRPRPDASVCPRELANRRDEIESWLREAIRQGHCGALWENGFPRHVWRREQSVVYEARLLNAGTGEYKGYPLGDDQIVRGLE